MPAVGIGWAQTAKEESLMTEAKKRQRRKDERPQEILHAALEVFAEKGFASAQVSEIAKRAGVAKGTVYLYYKTKQEIFEAIVRAKVSPVFVQLDEFLNQRQESAVELLTMILGHIYRELVDSPLRRVVIKVLISEGKQFPELVQFYHGEVLQFAQQLLHGVLARGLESGEFRDCPAMLEPRVVFGAAIMAAVWKMTFEDLSPLDLQQFLKAHLDVVLYGLIKR